IIPSSASTTLQRTTSRRSACFFQAEDGIRDFHVTGVQTCALPILTRNTLAPRQWRPVLCIVKGAVTPRSEYAPRIEHLFPVPRRSEERRVGKECRSRWSPYDYKENNEEACGSRIMHSKTSDVRSE